MAGYGKLFSLAGSSLCDEPMSTRWLFVFMISAQTIRSWRKQGRGPTFVKFGGARQAAVRYRREDLDAFVMAHLRASTSDVG